MRIIHIHVNSPILDQLKALLIKDQCQAPLSAG